MKVLICGSRTWVNPMPVRTTLAALHTAATAQQDTLTVIHGGASGADKIAGEIAAAMGLEVIVEPAKWAQHGRGAGPRRNQLMLEAHRPDMVFAFRVHGPSKGTDHMVSIARQAGVPTTVETAPQGEHQSLDWWLRVNRPRVRVHTYEVRPEVYDEMPHLDKHKWTLHVVDGGTDHGWGVHPGFSSIYCLGSRGEVVYQPPVASRTKTWWRNHRFPIEVALDLARTHVDTVEANGRTAADALATWRAREDTRR